MNSDGELLHYSSTVYYGMLLALYYVGKGEHNSKLILSAGLVLLYVFVNFCFC